MILLELSGQPIRFLHLFALARNHFTFAGTKFSNFGGAQSVMGSYGEPRGEEIFFKSAGSGGLAMEVSNSSPRRATAGVRMSIDLELGPLFGLNAMRAFEARAASAVRAGHGLQTSAPSRSRLRMAPKYLWDRKRVSRAPRDRGNVRISD